MVVIVTGYTLYVTSLYDVIFMFANQRFGEVCSHNVHIQGRRRSGREAVPSPRRAFCELSPSLQTKLQALPNWIMKYYRSVEFLSNFGMSSPH